VDVVEKAVVKEDWVDAEEGCKEGEYEKETLTMDSIEFNDLSLLCRDRRNGGPVRVMDMTCFDTGGAVRLNAPNDGKLLVFH
jgi:hypothetical protein